MTDPSEHGQEPSEHSSEEEATGQEGLGSLTVEDDPAGTVDPADLAGTANSDDAPVGPSAHQ